LDARLHHAL
jgi:hypothetical protein